jgi:ubiquitin C-terminal hydrolase
LKIVDFFMHIVYSSEERTSSSSTFLAWSSITAGKFGADFKVMLQKTKCSLLPDNQMLQLQKRLEDIMWWLVCHSSIEQAQPSSEELTAISCYTLRILQILVTNVIPKEMASSSAANTPLPVCVAAFVEWMSSGRFWSTFREVLLHCPHRDVRVEVATRLYALASSFPDDLISDPKLKLHTHLLENLLNTVPTIPVSSDSDNVSIIQYTGQFYLLLDRLIRDSCGGKHGGHAIKFQSLLTLLVKNIKVRPPIEMRATSEPDEMLIGMMKVVKTLVDYYPPFADQIGPSVHSESQHDGMERGLVIEVYYNGLFALLSEGITEGVQLPKCKTKLSQIAAYDLLISLCKNSAKCYQELLNRLFAIHCNEVNFRRISSWEYHPAAEDKSCTGYVGLKNMGATCYMNALLQQFYMMPKLRADLLSIDDPNPEPNLEDNLLYQLQSMFAYLQESEKMSYDPTSFCRSFKDLNGRVINMSEQHDVEEFFNILCQRLEAKFKGTPHEKLFSEHFGGTLSNEIFSTNSQYPYYSEREEDFYTIPLEVKNRSNIEEALDLYVKSDKLDGDNAYFCEQYNRKIDVLKRCCIKRLSNTLIFHLKRFDFDYATGRKQKLNSYFHFPIFLNMKRWTKEGLGKNELSTKGKAADSTVEENPDDYYQYELVGVLVHTGNAEDGHYYSFIKERQKKFENFSMGGSLTASRNLKQWFCFNDRIVKPFNPELIPEECFGGTQIYTEWDQFTGRRVTKEKPKEKSAYMLFYERIRPLPPHSLEISSKPQQSQQQSQPQQSQPQSQKQPQPQESQQQQVQFPIQMLPSIPTEERVQLLQQSSQQQQSASSQPRINGIPAKIYQNIWKENAQFLRDRQFFDPAYFDFMRDLLNACKFQPVLQYPTLANPIDSINDDGNELRQIKMSTRFFVEILARAKDNEAHVGRWVDDMKKVYSMHIPACVWFLTYVLQNNVLYPLILECPSERLRIAFADLLIHIFKTLSPYEYTMWHDYQLIQVETDSATKSVKQRLSLVLRTMDALLAMIEQSRPCWRRFKQYWMIIHDFASIGWRQRYYLFEKELICVYEDYFMGRQRLGMSRAPVMDEESLPDLREFVDTITILLRGCWTEGTFVKTADAKSSLPSTQKIENSSSATSDSSIVSDSSSCPIPAVPPPHTVGLPPNWRMSPYLQTPVNPFTTPWTLREPDIVLLSMSEMSRKVMFEGEFLIRFLEMDYNTPSAAILLAHICWESLDRSKFVTETLLQCYSTCSQHKLRIFHQLTEPLLKMTDSLMRRRIHWFLSPFSPSFSLAQSFQFSNVVSTKGLLGIIVDAHEHKDRKALSIIYFVLKVASEHRPVLEYLLKRKSRLQWIKEYLECKLVDQRDVLQNDKTKESLQVCRDSDRTEVDINEIEKNPAPYAYELLAKLFDMKDISLEPDGADEELNETLMKLAKAQKDIELLRDQNAKLLQENNALRQKLKQIQSNESEIDTTCPQDTAETQKQNRPMSYTAIHESLDKQLESAPPLGRSRLGPQRGTGQSSNIPFLGYASYNNNTSVYDDDEEENSVQLGKPLEIFRKDDTNTPKQLTKSDVDGRSQEQTPKSTTSTSSEGVSSQLSTKMTTTVPSLNNLSQTTTNAASVTLPSTSTDLPLPQPTNEFESNPNLKKLKEIFTGIEDSVLSYALKISGNDVEIAASELMENDKVNRFRISVQNERQSKRNETKVQSYDDNVESEKGNLRRENDMSKTIILLPRQEHSPNVENRDAKFHDDEIDTLFNSKSQDDKIH